MLRPEAVEVCPNLQETFHDWDLRVDTVQAYCRLPSEDYCVAGDGAEAQSKKVACDCCIKQFPIAAVKTTSDQHLICGNCEEELKAFHQNGRTTNVQKRCYRCKRMQQLEIWHDCSGYDGKPSTNA